MSNFAALDLVADFASLPDLMEFFVYNSEIFEKFSGFCSCCLDLVPEIDRGLLRIDPKPPVLRGEDWALDLPGRLCRVLRFDITDRLKEEKSWVWLATTY